MRHSIYIVDDNWAVREALVLLIESEEDLRVCGTAGTAAEALNGIPEAEPDLVITDLSLPEISGIELVARLRTLRPGQRTVILSGHPEAEYASRAREAGANGCIMKGDPEMMLEGIREALKNSGSESSRTNH